MTAHTVELPLPDLGYSWLVANHAESEHLCRQQALVRFCPAQIQFLENRQWQLIVRNVLTFYTQDSLPMHSAKLCYYLSISLLNDKDVTIACLIFQNISAEPITQ